MFDSTIGEEFMDAGSKAGILPHSGMKQHIKG
jgi:hypothetical protein